MPKKLTQEEFKLKVENKYPNTFHNFSKFEGADKSIEMYCKLHDFKCTTTQSKRFYQNGSEHPCFYCRKENGRRTSTTYTTEMFIKEVKKTYPDLPLTFEKTIMKGKKSNITVTCKLHGDITKTPDTILRYGCTSCRLEKGEKTSRRFTKQFFIFEIERKYPNTFDFTNFKWNGFNKKSTFICKIHGNIGEHNPSNILKNGCNECSRDSGNLNSGAPLTKKYLITKLSKQIPEPIFNNFDFSSVPETFKSNYILPLKCKLHGDLSNTWTNVKDWTIGCNQCAKENNLFSWTNEQFIEKIKEIWPDEYSFENTKYISAHDLVTITHKKCGKDIIKSGLIFTNHQIGCTYCSPQSGPENEIRKHVESLGFNTTSPRPKWMGYKGIDVFIENINLAIEYNGYMYHHSSKSEFVSDYAKNTYKDPKYHYNKWKACFDNDIALLSIYDFYWNVPIKQEIYKSKIRHYLGLDKRIFARKCKIVEVDNKEAYQFYENNHLEGKGKAYSNSKSFALEYDGIKYMYATIGQFYNQSSKSKVYKLHRICTLLDHTVIGGASKLTKHLKSLYGEFVYQITLSSGGSMLKGCKDFKIIEPRYFWVRRNKYYHRNSTQKHLLEKNFGEPVLETDTENTYMERLGYLKVYDNGLASLTF